MSIGTNPEAVLSQEFKKGAASLGVNGRLTVAEARRRLSISEQTLRNRIKTWVAGITCVSADEGWMW